MNKYALIKRLYHEHWLQGYMYAFVYVYPETIEEKDYFTYTKIITKTTRKGQLQD